MITYKLLALFFILTSHFNLGSSSVQDEISHFETIGTINITVLNKGTFSEIKYFTIKSNKTEVIIFNENGKSNGFDDYIGKKVSIIYEEYEGKIDWRGNRAIGYKILSIETVK